MLDLLGFWGNVTLLTVIAFIPVIWITQGLIFHYIVKITGSKSKGKAVTRKIWDWNLNEKGVHTYFEYDDCLEEVGTHMKIFNRCLLNSGWMAVFAITSGFFWLIALFFLVQDGGQALMMVVSKTSEKFASITGYLFAFFIAYQGSIWLGKKCYHLIQRVEKVVGTLNESKD